MIKISVVIPSYNGAHKIRRLLRSLEKQSYSDFETIVVIDGSTDDTEKLIRSENYALRDLKIVFQENQGRSITRNNGAKQASGNIILFIDDDMEAEATLVQKHVDFHSGHAGSILIGSPFRKAEDARTGFDQFQLKVENSWIKNLEPGTVSYSNFAFTAQQCSLSRILFVELGTFDERLTDAEDFDLGIRALQHDVPIWFDPTIITWHCDWPKLDQYIRRHRQYLNANRKLLGLHPDYAALFPGLTVQPSAGIKKKIARSFAHLAGKAIAEDKYSFKILPLRLKFLLIRLVISGSLD